jgi:hypothetical protein
MRRSDLGFREGTVSPLGALADGTCILPVICGCHPSTIDIWQHEALMRSMMGNNVERAVESHFVAEVNILHLLVIPRRNHPFPPGMCLRQAALIRRVSWFSIPRGLARRVS